jgi:hypothetical protein
VRCAQRQHGIFGKLLGFGTLGFPDLFNPRPGTCQYNLEPGGIFDLSAESTSAFILLKTPPPVRRLKPFYNS